MDKDLLINKIRKYQVKNNLENKEIYIKKLKFYINAYKNFILSGSNGTNVAKPTMFFVATHDNRLQCLLSQLFSITNPEYHKITRRLQNCAIIKIFNKDNELAVEMIYEGETTEDKQNFWTKSSFDVFHSKRPLNNDKFKFLKLNKNTTIFFIRHGKGIHNMDMTKRKLIGALDIIKKNIISDYDQQHSLTDANLDDIGVNQAKKAGESLKKYLNNNYKDWNNYNLLFGSSRLYRTRQTIGTIMTKILNEPNKYKIIVIPCVHEIAVVEKTGKCVDTGFKNDLAYENKSVCEKDKENKKCKDLNIDNKIIKIDWSYYESNKDCIKNENNIINIVNDLATKITQKITQKI